MTRFARLHQKISEYVSVVQRFVDRIWYPPFIGLLAALDNLILIIPNDGLLISSSMLVPKRWFALALSVAIGSALGALLLGFLVDAYGHEWILQLSPGMHETNTWRWMESFFDQYGLYLVFLVAVTPFFQQPAVILASLSGAPLLELAAVVFTGRFIKFLIMAYIATHAPRLLTKFWGIKAELDDVGVKLK